MSYILLVGASSGIAQALAKKLAEKGKNLLLAGRTMDDLERQKADLEFRYGVSVKTQYFDADDLEKKEWLEKLVLQYPKIDGAIVAYGYLGDQKEAERESVKVIPIINVNFTSTAVLLHELANYFEYRRSGYICVLSSVAADRGRQSNYVYGAAKGGLTVFLQGLRNRLSPANVRVITVKPGLVDTKMTYGKVESRLLTSPEKVAKLIIKAIEGKKDVVYIPAVWALIMFVVRHIPERIFKKMKL